MGRARAAMMARFLAGDATHLLFIDSDAGFEPSTVLQLLDAGHDVAEDAGALLISRSAAQRMKGAHPQLHARLDDMHAIGIPAAAMVFDPIVERSTGRYLTDRQAFCHRWRVLGGEVSTHRLAQPPG
jgi:hypothetical protein